MQRLRKDGKRSRPLNTANGRELSMSYTAPAAGAKVVVTIEGETLCRYGLKVVLEENVKPLFLDRVDQQQRMMGPNENFELAQLVG